MKVLGPGALDRKLERSRTATAANGADFARHLAGSDDARAPELAREASALGSIDALLALQGDQDDAGAETRHGQALLDELEVIRTGLLIGRIPRESLATLARLLERRKVFASSPKLASVIDEIELRVKVELAKLSAI